MHHQPPLVLDAAVRNERILRATRHRLPIILRSRRERQDARRLIAGLGELRKTNNGNWKLVRQTD